MTSTFYVVSIKGHRTAINDTSSLELFVRLHIADPKLQVICVNMETGRATDNTKTWREIASIPQFAGTEYEHDEEPEPREVRSHEDQERHGFEQA